MHYKTTVYSINLKTMKGLDDCRIEAARLYNDVKNLHKYLRKRHWGWSSKYDFQKHFKKKKYALHSQTVQFIIDNFFF